jgi:hypothetical protein
MYELYDKVELKDGRKGDIVDTLFICSKKHIDFTAHILNWAYTISEGLQNIRFHVIL